MIPVILGALGRVAQFGLNQLAINRQNRYNSPIAQVGRLKKAGLNPALIYQNIQPDSQTQPNQYPDSTLSHDITQYLEHQTSQYNAETQRNAQETNKGKTEQETKALKMANDIQEALKKYIDQNPDSYYLPQVKRYLAEYNQIISNTNLSDQQHEINRVNQELSETKFWMDMQISEETRKNIAEDTKLKTKQIDKLVKEGKILDEDLKYYVQRFLTSPTPWFADLVKTIVADKLGLDPTKSSTTEVVEQLFDEIKSDTEEVKTQGKRKFSAIYRSKYVSHDSENTYRIITSGPDKGKTIKVNQKTGHIEFME